MRVGIHSPYLGTYGGGERYLYTVAEFFEKRGDQVEIFWDEKVDREKIRYQFSIDLSRVKFVPNIFALKNLFFKLLATAKYDLIFLLSDGSIPSTFAKKNILHLQVPFNCSDRKTLANWIKLKKIEHIVCNSAFTKKYIDQTYGVESKILYPPVDVESFQSEKKKNVILTVGRFFSPSHPKKQEQMIEAFKKFSQEIKNWKFVLAGGVTGASQDEVERLKGAIRDYNIEIVTDLSFEKLKNLYSTAKIYWHAAGYGENLEKNPDRAEHFGITTVEAMAGGCVPIVFCGGGQQEIVEDGVNGFFWSTSGELIEKTRFVVNNIDIQKVVSAAAIQKSKIYSKERFFESLKLLVND